MTVEKIYITPANVFILPPIQLRLAKRTRVHRWMDGTTTEWRQWCKRLYDSATTYI